MEAADSRLGKKGQTLLYKLYCICLTVGCGICRLYAVMRKKRVVQAGKCYHLVSRVAHRAFFFIYSC